MKMIMFVYCKTMLKKGEDYTEVLLREGVLDMDLIFKLLAAVFVYMCYEIFLYAALV